MITHKPSRYFIKAALMLTIIHPCASAADAPQVSILAGPPDGSLKIINLVFKVGVGDDNRSALAQKSSPIMDKDSYEIVKVGANEPPLKIAVIKPNWKKGGASTIDLIMEKPVIPSDYTVKLKGDWTVVVGGKSYVYKSPEKLPVIPKDYFEIEASHMDQIGFKNSAEISRASEGTAVDFNLFTYGNLYDNPDQTFDFDHLRYEGRIKGQVGLDAGNRDLYADSWTAELSLNARARIGELQNKWRIPVYYAFSTELEGDKNFENLTGATGLWIKLETAKLSQPIYNLFYEHNPFVIKTEDPEPAALAPYWELGYQFATELKDDGTGFDYGDHRITGRLTWELPLMRHLGPDAFKVNGDLVIAAEGIYHPETGDVTNNTKLSAIFRRDTKEKNPLTLTVTYQQGKTTPTFENYESLLVGFRQFF